MHLRAGQCGLSRDDFHDVSVAENLHAGTGRARTDRRQLPADLDGECRETWRREVQRPSGLDAMEDAGQAAPGHERGTRGVGGGEEFWFRERRPIDRASTVASGSRVGRRVLSGKALRSVMVARATASLRQRCRKSSLGERA